jgi:HSP20 family protein
MYYRNDNLNALFDDVVRNFFQRPQSEARESAVQARWTPAVDAWVEGDKFVLQAFLAGVDPKSVELTATGNRLTIKGVRDRRTPKDARSFAFGEVVYGAFERTLELPEGTDAGKAEARFENGVLEVRLPALGAFVPKKIEIGAGSAEQNKLHAA